MTDSDLEAIYKASLPRSHFAGLRAVYDAGCAATANVDPVVPPVDVAPSEPSLTEKEVPASAP